MASHLLLPLTIELSILYTYTTQGPGAGYPEPHPDPQSTSGPKTGNSIIPLLEARSLANDMTNLGEIGCQEPCLVIGYSRSLERLISFPGLVYMELTLGYREATTEEHTAALSTC